uniref:Uncharacterized protein n=2 Tax=Cacopsylla melanoneura TaxID=428564 RepID=A0A8D8STG6_9HEMI
MSKKKKKIFFKLKKKIVINEEKLKDRTWWRGRGSDWNDLRFDDDLGSMLKTTLLFFQRAPKRMMMLKPARFAFPLRMRQTRSITQAWHAKLHRIVFDAKHRMPISDQCFDAAILARNFRQICRILGANFPNYFGQWYCNDDIFVCTVRTRM